MNAIVYCGFALVAGLSTACSGSVSVTPSGAHAPVDEGKMNEDARHGNLVVEEVIMKTCGLPKPHFAFDSSTVEASSDENLDKLAVCFTSGPLAGRKLRLVGHTDPRGDLDYNFALGQRRAGRVGSYIEKHGVAESQVAASSRGEMDAVGTNPEGWASDRRVDILLAN